MNVYQKLSDKTEFLYFFSRRLENRMENQMTDEDRDLFIKTLESTAQEVFYLIKHIKNEEK